MENKEMTTVTLNQLLEIENVLATRKIPSDIEAVTKWKYFSDSKEKWVTLGDQPLHYVLRILTKMKWDNDFKVWQLDKGE
tara:strand:+ start:264 stop:503 length:240 start_codon:yes stop_codon:yes gene_type:complete